MKPTQNTSLVVDDTTIDATAQTAPRETQEQATGIFGAIARARRTLIEQLRTHTPRSKQARPTISRLEPRIVMDGTGLLEAPDDATLHSPTEAEVGELLSEDAFLTTEAAAETEAELAALTQQLAELTTQIEEHGEDYREGVTEIDGPVALSRKTPHYTTGYLEVDANNPIVARGTFTFEEQSSTPGMFIAQNETTDHRNGLRNAIYINIGRSGYCGIYQFLGSDQNVRSETVFNEMAVGSTVDIEVHYDGSTVRALFYNNGELLGEQTLETERAYTSARIGYSNHRWDSDVQSVTMQNIQISQGELPASLGEQQADIEQRIAGLQSILTSYAATLEKQEVTIQEANTDSEELLISNEAILSEDVYSEKEAELAVLREQRNDIDTQIAEFGEDHREGVTEIDGPVALSRKTPRFVTDYLNVDAQNPITARASFTFDVGGQSMPSVIFAANTTTDHRNGLRNAIYIRIARNGYCGINQFLGSDRNVRSETMFNEMAVGSTIDIEAHYDGRTVRALFYNNRELLGELTLETQIPYGSALVGVSNNRWDASDVTTTLTNMQISQGELSASLGELRAEIEDNIANIEAALAAHVEALQERSLNTGNEPVVDAALVDQLFSEETSTNDEDIATVATVQVAEALPNPEASWESIRISQSDTPEERLAKLAEKQELLQVEINDLELQKLDIDTQMAREGVLNLSELQAESDDLQSQIDALSREMIPYSYMTVHTDADHISNDHFFNVQFASNQTQTYFELLWNGEPGSVFRRTIEHAPGMQQGFTKFDMHNTGGANGSGEVIIRMYTDESKSELIDEFHGSFERGDPRGATGKTNGNFGDLETGRIVDSPYKTAIVVDTISGPNVILGVQNMYDGMRVQMDGGGMFNRETFLNEGGSDLTPVRLTFNADNPSGYYDVKVYETRNNSYQGATRFYWDANTGELSLESVNPTIVAEADSENARTMYAMKQQLLDQVAVDNIDIGIGSLRNVVDTHLYENSEFYIDPSADEAFYLQEFALQGHPDASSIFRQTVSGYEAALKESLRAASKVAVAAWNGDSQQDAIDFFHREYTRTSVYRYLQEFLADFHAEYPSADAVLHEGIELAEQQAAGFVDAMAKQESMYAARSYDANRKGTEDDNNIISQEAWLHNRTIVAAQYGENSEQIFAYEASWIPEGGYIDPVLVTSNTTVERMEDTLVQSEQYVVSGGVIYVEPETLSFGSRLNEELSAIDTSILTFDNSSETEVLEGSENSLVVVIYGAGQVPGKGEQGFDQLTSSLSNASHLISIRSGNRIGNNPDDFGYRKALEEIKLVISDYLSQNSNIDSIIIAGYSWGGGATYEVADWITNDPNAPKIEIKATAYVDAIMHGFASSEVRLPPGTENHSNWFQQEDYVLIGSETNNSDGYQGNITATSDGDPIDHYNIDEEVYDDVSNYIINLLKYES